MKDIAAALCAALLLAGCAGAGFGLVKKGASADQIAGQVEITVRELYVVVYDASTKETASRQACAQGKPPPECRPFGHYMTRERGEYLLDWLGRVKTANRLAQDAFAASAACVAGQELEALNLSGCVNPATVINAALAAVTEMRKKMEARP